jgi:hypothetical protein
MHPQTLFSASGKLVMAGWALLVFAPRWRWSQRIASAIIPLTLAMVYLVLIVLYFAKSPGGFGTLAQVAQLFSESLALACRMDTLLGFRLISGRVAGTAGSAPWDFPRSSCSVFAAHVSIWPHRSPCISGYSFCSEATTVP